MAFALRSILSFIIIMVVIVVYSVYDEIQIKQLLLPPVVNPLKY